MESNLNNHNNPISKEEKIKILEFERKRNGKFMEYNRLNRFIEEHHVEISNFVGHNIYSLDAMIKKINTSKNKSNKLYEMTRDLSKIIDFHDEKNKININRAEFSIACLEQLNKTFTQSQVDDYTDIFNVIINKSMEFNEENWNMFYDTILKSTKDSVNENEINKTVLYSLNHEELTPKRLVAIFQKNINDDMLRGGAFSFQSGTQEMMGIVNEFVISKGKKETLIYLNQGKNKETKITELLKEVNAASLVEPFTFKEDNPIFKVAAAGQFDGFILQKETAKLILATKSENTNIEGDSLFRHFITAIVIKDKIDKIIPSERCIKRKQRDWYNYYTSNEVVKTYTQDALAYKRELKNKNGAELILSDFYIGDEFYLNLKEEIDRVENSDSVIVKVSTINDYSEKTLDFATKVELFKNKKLYTSSGVFHLNLDDAKQMLGDIVNARAYQNTFKNEIEIKARKKIINDKFKDQIILDVKKEDVVISAKFLSMKDMVSHLNRNTNEALIELGIFKKGSVNNNINFDKMEMIKQKAMDINLDLIYFGSVSTKQSAPADEYDRGFTNKKYTNKEFRYGMNILAYANILSCSPKNGFTITTDAALLFISAINLRATTKIKNGKTDLDLDVINKDSFLKDISYIMYKSMYENNIIKSDSVDFFENFFNSTNVLLNDLTQEYNADKSINKMASIEDSFNIMMKNITNRNEKFDLVKTIRSLKKCILIQSKKIKNTSLIDSLNQRIDSIINLSDDKKMKLVSQFYNQDEIDRDKNSRLQRRLFN